MTEQQRDNRLVKLTTLWERTSAKGRRYFSGFMGDVQVLMFEAGDVARPSGEVVKTWKLLVQERDPDRRPQARQERPSQDLPTGQTRIVRNERRDARQDRIEELADKFEPDEEPPF